MPTLLLTFILLLSGSNSPSARVNITADSDPSQAEPVFLDPLPDQVATVEDPSLRIFLRLKIAAYLWTNPHASAKPANEVALAALVDLNAHEAEVSPQYADLFRRELIAQLKAHGYEAPSPSTEEAQLTSPTKFEVAYALLNQEGGTDKAVGIVRGEIAAGKDPGAIIVFFLHQLEKVTATEVPGVLDALIAAEETHPGYLSARALFTLEHLYIRKQTPPALQSRYMAALVTRAGDMKANTDETVDIYVTLSNALAAEDKQLSKLYPIASARLAQLAAQIPSGTRERLAVDKRIEQSGDLLAQLLIEADSVTDQSLKEELLTRAAQLSLEKGQTQAAIELVGKLRPTTPEARLWRDQFIEEAVERALAQGDVETARHATTKIQAASSRSAAMQKIALHLQASGDVVGARETLNSALDAISAIGDGADKAAALFDLTGAYTKVDSQRAPQLVRAAVVAVNKMPAVRRRIGDIGITPAADIDDVMKLAYRIIPAFQALGATDRSRALDLAEGIQKQELKLVATLAVRTSQPVVKHQPALALR